MVVQPGSTSCFSGVHSNRHHPRSLWDVRNCYAVVKEGGCSKRRCLPSNKTNAALEHPPFNTSIYRGFSIGTFDYQGVVHSVCRIQSFLLGFQMEGIHGCIRLRFSWTLLRQGLLCSSASLSHPMAATDGNTTNSVKHTVHIYIYNIMNHHVTNTM